MRVAMIGYGFMGAAHSQGWRVAPRFFDLPSFPEMTVVVGRNGDAVAAAAEKWGWAESATDWREVIARDDIDEIRPGTVSTMPSGLDQQLTRQELADLIAFLRAAK